ncbi:MAG: hypothetical protein CMO01_18825 [Thalassobius sp.]|nr:hypothetical protein [Thalassovita sp.]
MEVKLKLLMAHINKTLLLVFFCFACSKNHLLYQTWLPISVDRENDSTNLNQQDYLDFAFTITKNNIKYQGLRGYPISEEKIKITLNKKIELHEKFDSSYYDIINLTRDSLKLKYYSSFFQNRVQGFIPFPVYKINKSFNELNELLINNYWEIEVDGFRYELEFKRQSPIHKSPIYDWKFDYFGFNCLIHCFKNKNYIYTDGAYLDIENINNTNILSLKSYFKKLNYNFFITELTSNAINANLITQNNITKVNFNKIDLDSNTFNFIYDKLISNKLHVEKTEFLKDTATANNSRFLIYNKVLENSVIKSSDLQNRQITYSLYPDSTFEIHNKNNLLLTGKWQLYAKGQLVNLIEDWDEMTERHITNYKIPGGIFYIKNYNEDEFIIQKAEELYINDSTFITDMTLQKWR